MNRIKFTIYILCIPKSCHNHVLARAIDVNGKCLRKRHAQPMFVRHEHILMACLTLMLTFADRMLFSGRYGAKHGFVFYVWGVKNHRNIRFVATQTGISKMNL